MLLFIPLASVTLILFLAWMWFDEMDRTPFADVRKKRCAAGAELTGGALCLLGFIGGPHTALRAIIGAVGVILFALAIYTVLKHALWRAPEPMFRPGGGPPRVK
jgi:hypothetical protein